MEAKIDFHYGRSLQFATIPRSVRTAAKKKQREWNECTEAENEEEKCFGKCRAVMSLQAK
jgi:hypothetical protein